jgi:hypothetical protein
MTAVYLEIGGKRVFACAVDWPGWCRSGKTEDLALQALASYAPRYAPVAEHAGLAFSPPTGVDVVERLEGSGGTDFGVPGKVAAGDAQPLTGEEASRHTALLEAAWAIFDRIAATAPAELRKGPRGGGRDRDKIVDHVLGAEAAYARMIGLKHRQPPPNDRTAIAALRHAIITALSAPSDGSPLAPKGWPARYATRRFAWHVLDHAWEIEDRTLR